MSEAKHAHAHTTAAHPHDVKAKDLEPMKGAPQEKPEPSRAAGKAPKAEKPMTLEQRLDDIKRRVEAVYHSPVATGKAEACQDCWDDLDEVGDGGDNPADVAMVQAAHNHLQHYVPRHASQLDALEAQLEAAHEQSQKPEARPDTPELAAVKQRIADTQTRLANDPRALPGDKQRAQELSHKVTQINAEKATT